MGLLTVTAAHDTLDYLLAQVRAKWRVYEAEFRRCATTRQATVAGAVTNTVFGLVPV